MTIEEGIMNEIDEIATELSAHDRCDACGAQAYVRVLLKNGELDLCAHHYAKAIGNKMAVVEIVFDDRYKLETKLSASA